VLAALMLLLPSVPGMAVPEDENTVYKVVSERKKLYSLADTNYLIEDYQIYFLPDKSVIQAESFNRVLSAFPNVETYVYLATSSRSMDFDRLDAVPPLYELIRENYPNSKTDLLPIHSIEDYCRYYYKTDHHWNYLGSYTGYQQIIRMMLGADEPLMKPVETVTFSVNFNGSLNKLISRDNSDEPFTVYRFDFPEMTVRINGKRKNSYGKQDAYFDGKYSKRDKLVNHYGEFYGGDQGIVQFTTGDETKENILVFAGSFSNAVDMLIASHFNNSYFVDLRHYKDDMGEKFNLTNSIKDWNISKVLLLGDGYFFKWGTTYR
jgi:hypothetical protein